jgi:hypothetical protein
MHRLSSLARYSFSSASYRPAAVRHPLRTLAFFSLFFGRGSAQPSAGKSAYTMGSAQPMQVTNKHFGERLF